MFIFCVHVYLLLRDHLTLFTKRSIFSCCYVYSQGIESVVDDKAGKSAGFRDAMCSACEMAVVWMQNQLNQNQTQERILNYANEVC